jgi:hypothetical protein
MSNHEGTTYQLANKYLLPTQIFTLPFYGTMWSVKLLVQPVGTTNDSTNDIDKS